MYTTQQRETSYFKSWSCTDIVQVVLSLAHARLDEMPLLVTLYTEALSRLAEQELSGTSRVQRGGMRFQAWEISVLLWAQARFHLKESQGQVFGTFAKRAVELISLELRREKTLKAIGIGLQEQANIAWSLTVLELYKNVDTADLLKAIFAEAAASCQENDSIQLEHAHQLWQSLFLLEDDYPVAVASVPQWFRDCLKDKWALEKARPKISSAWHMSLSQTLKLMGVAHFNEHDEDIDVAIVLKPDASWTHETERSSVKRGVRVAVEFDGPNHFTRQRSSSVRTAKPEPPRSLGHSVLKYRILKKQGWTVVRIPYFEYTKIPFWASMERQRYLQRLLKTHGNIRFSNVDVSDYQVPVPNRGSRYD
jgi:RAP domain